MINAAVESDLNDYSSLPEYVTPEDFLRREALAAQKHEYVGGLIYAMAGGVERHSRICGSILRSLGNQLEDRTCEVFNSDMAVRLQLPPLTRFYYPDAHVVCELAADDSVQFHDKPVIIIEVLSETTRRVDLVEKREAYLTIESLRVYIMLEQHIPLAEVWRRDATGFVSERWSGLDVVIPLPEIDAGLPLAAVYRKVEFGPEAHAAEQVIAEKS